MITLSRPNKLIFTEVKLPASKSLSNRLLIIQFLMQHSFTIENLSDCNDTQHLVQALVNIKAEELNKKSNCIMVDVGEAGTSYRFLAALLATLPGNYELKGSDKLMKRPMKVLLDALISLGATIHDNDGKGPISINGTTLKGGNVSLDAATSSQFISALLMIAPYFKEGLRLELKGKIVSLTYIKMTLGLMKLFGAHVEFENNIIHVNYRPYQSNLKSYFVESDWTAASYWYALASLSMDCSIKLIGLREQSFQGDSILPHLFRIYGIKSNFDEKGVTISKSFHQGFIHIYDFIDQPDLVQTFAFLNTALGLPIHINNASNLVYKETNRIEALATELKKIGASILLNNFDDFSFENKKPFLIENEIFETYQDHRMAMAAALLAMVFDKVNIANESVVSKSYPAFWKHLEAAGFEIEYY
jgi:3-phosphoshikimate 1-carboxyvinyltransferase